MITMKAVYTGDKHCEITHGPSGAKISTDAPKDNNGKGETFSPTDLVGAALGTCVLTVMAISAERDNIDLKGSYSEVTKEMQANPRRIARLPVNIHLPKSLTPEQRHKLEVIAKTCPVHRSLLHEIDSAILFFYDI